MEFKEQINRILSIKRRMPNPYKGHPRLFFGSNTFQKGADYHWNGLQRKCSQWHPQVLFQHTLSGWGKFTREKKSWSVGPGQAFITIIPSDHIYELPPESPGWSFFFLTFQHPYIAERISNTLEKHCGFITLAENSPLILKSVDLIKLTQSGLLTNPHEEESHLLDWMCSAENTLEEATRPLHEKDIWQTRVRTILEQDLASPLSIDDLARQLNLSRSHFTRLFTQKTGISPASFITALRLHHVEEALRLTDNNLTDIALDFGYADANHLCKVFKRHYGITPGNFRKQLYNR